MELMAGDRLLVKRVTYPTAAFSDLIAWWLHSRWSHIVPVLSPDSVLDITWPRPKLTHASHFLDGNYRVKILRPVTPFTDLQRTAWVATGMLLRERRYDLKSFLGFVTNGAEQVQHQVNCAEGVLAMDQAAGLLTHHDGRLISPQTYDDFATAGLFQEVTL